MFLARNKLKICVLVYNFSRKWMMLKVRYKKRYRGWCKKRKRTFLHMWYPKSCWVRTCAHVRITISFLVLFFCTFLIFHLSENCQFGWTITKGNPKSYTLVLVFPPEICFISFKNTRHLSIFLAIGR